MYQYLLPNTYSQAKLKRKVFLTYEKHGACFDLLIELPEGSMEANMIFSEVKLFQVKPDKLEEFESLVKEMQSYQKEQEGSIDINYMKRFYVFDEIGELPRPLTKIVKCVKYYSFWKFDTIEHYSNATKWFFQEYEKKLSKLLIMPFDIMCGENID